MDALIEDGILRDIPFIGTVFSVYITIISEYNNEKDRAAIAKAFEDLMQLSKELSMPNPDDPHDNVR